MVKARSLFIPFALIQLYLLTWAWNTNAIEPGLVVAYILMPIVPMVYYGLPMSKIENKKPLYNPIGKAFKVFKHRGFIVQLSYYVLAFAATWLIVFVAYLLGLFIVPTVLPQYSINLIIFQIFLVSISETLFFHAILPIVFDDWSLRNKSISNRQKLIMKYGATQFLFAMWHFSIFQGNIGYLIFAFIVGCIFLFIAEMVGRSATAGVHAAYNCVVTGAFMSFMYIT